MIQKPPGEIHGWPQQMLPQEVFSFLHAEMGKNGPVYGVQQVQRWAAGNNETQPLLDVGAAASLWRLSVQGGLLVDVTWGTSRQFKLLALETPLVGYFPGNLFVEARPRDPEHGDTLISTVTLTPTSAPGRSNLRRVISTAGGGVIPIDAMAMQSIGLTAAVTQNGLATTLDDDAGATPIEHPAAVTAGRIHVFFEP